MTKKQIISLSQSKYIFILLLNINIISVFGQSIFLKPTIGIASLPLDSDSICMIPVYTGNYQTSGLQSGDTIADFTFYTPAGNPVHIQAELAEGKPILLVAGNYTCPVYRDKMPVLNYIYNTYPNDIKIFIVNVVEAHPINGPSPYSGSVWVTSQNQQQGVLYEQPKTYGQRKTLVNTMLSNMTILPTVLLDGPCNNWWEYFGPAPNNAYLIKPNGVVYTKHAWFHKSPDNMICDIDSLLGIPCNSSPASGSFVFNLDTDSFASALAGTVIEIHSTLTNNSSSAAEIEIKRLQNNIPSGWETAMCADVCLQPWVNAFSFQIPANSSQPFTMYFYTDNNEDTASTRIQYLNKYDPSNKIIQNYFASTLISSVSLNEHIPLQFLIYPNPFYDELIIDFEGINKESLIIKDIYGKSLYSAKLNPGKNNLDLSFLNAGIYFYEFNKDNNTHKKGKIIKR
ncbi:MAG: T9SS type A sorting domain-containing protein [Bacteroidetes bacterium]|nr:T9SS type A sorting domain-containing protein [Bacteroidota bacterium]HET6246038.1 T9SS type A sorting domain-containing protein [Bacteroidia bacterium]